MDIRLKRSYDHAARTDGPGFETATSKSSSLMGPQRT